MAETNPKPDEPYDVVSEVHLNGIPWWDAPLPGKWHRCQAQTIQHITVVLSRWRLPTERRTAPFERCACGADRQEGHGWENKNSRRRGVWQSKAK